MFLDASVVVAILAEEPGGDEIAKRLEDAKEQFFVSPLVRYEAITSLARKKAGRTRAASRALMAEAREIVDDFIATMNAREIAISPEIGSIAIEATMKFGRTVGHPADLNFGDCFAYACAKSLGTKLAYKGNDFALTDMA